MGRFGDILSELVIEAGKTVARKGDDSGFEAVVPAPSNAQKNSDITKAEIEYKLTGEISTHSHAGSGGGLTQPQVLARVSLRC